MPPIRTAKQNSTATKGVDAYFKKVSKAEAQAEAVAYNAPQPAPAIPIPAPKPKVAKVMRLLPPAGRGVKDASFRDSRYDWDGKFNKLVGIATKKLEFRSSFKLTDQHIEDILAMRPKICRDLTEFKFVYGDVSYDANNGAKGLTDTAVINLAKHCPKLRKIYLPDTTSLSGEALLRLLASCPALTYVEMTGSRMTATLFEIFQQHPEWVPKLKTLRLTDPHQDTKFMKAMRELGRDRPNLKVELVSTSQEKNWGDWDLKVYHTTYMNGRKVGTSY
ncbi:uncharacterized protein K460DRAFT_401112 [Cucurbitaria berberidis CBS 394.84]|uniref:Uncharacterized protein n=1 Tax=Cucurbitaria berberidis CBS 394.84 TaxID=1168544 RepID=A0A9P4GST1_9PLEO|nr:uncharacterized protein K460DRAFT_401112 [Cucurbitaria berberidis CBS 394.84]KAF1851085.1 hypothetical protein K460DRAFT_401112 [Cucurbitaria berberidis CBS 394.84]